MKLRSSIIDVDRLATAARNAMFRLMDECYANVTRHAFEADLCSKQWVIQVHDPSTGELAGFSTQVVLTAVVDGRQIRALFSGDTVVARKHWGDRALAHAWGRLSLDLMEANEVDCLYWFLTSKGFRTYRYLPLFFKQYYPRCDAATPEFERSVIDAYGSMLAPNWYDARTQIIRAAPGKDYVRPEVADPQARSLGNEHIRFFISRNPSYDRGDELCCLAPLTKENFTSAAYRVIGPSSRVLLAR